MKAYIAAGWFTHKQEVRLNELLAACRKAGVEVYSPRDDFQYIKGMNPGKVFDANIIEIMEADFILASTEGKDMGTLFECGFAYARNKRVVYFYPGSGKFNLMLAESSTAVCSTKQELDEYLAMAVQTGNVPWMEYKGHIE